MLIGNAYGIPTVALRLFNVFGSRQGPANPYTGILTAIASSLLQDEAPKIPEDGHQQRDYVSVHDAVTAFRLALEVPEAAGGTFNIGSGRSHTLRTVAELMAKTAGKEHLQPEVTGACRPGDVRHCIADISLARRVLGYEPKVSLPEGFFGLVGWLSEQDTATERQAAQQLDAEPLPM
jgi:dTDP-L-rhamnose 4-epimerase